MKKYASEVVKQAQAWLGKKESDGSFKEIIDIYNSHPLARGYKMRFSDEWCAAFVSAVAIKLGYTDIIPTECSCTRMIANFVSLGEWEERDNVVPKPGWILFYDWKDNGIGDNKSNPSHVGIVEKVTITHIYVIEGNYGEEVKRRKITINSKYIRGFGVPKYDAEPKAEKKPTAQPVQKAAFTVKEWQKAAIADGYKFPVYGADGKWGAECESVAKKAIVKKRLFYTNKNLTKLVQKAVGFTGEDVDGLCGNKTALAIEKWQIKNGFTGKGVDRCIGINGWKKMLGV